MAFNIPQLGGLWNIPSTAAAYSLNVTVVPHGPLGYLTLWPTGEDQPLVSTMNSFDGRFKANAAIVPAGYQGAVSMYASNTADVVLDIDGYFAPVSESTLAFYPLTPCRVADTRNATGQLGGPYLKAWQERDFPVQASPCNIPSTAQAYSLNFTALPRTGVLGYMTVWPLGQKQPLVSTLNAPTGAVTANAAIVPSGYIGNIAMFATDNTDLLIDVTGYFAPAGAGGLSLYPMAPCRVLDTRLTAGWFSGTVGSDVVDSVCAPPETRPRRTSSMPRCCRVGSLGYLSLWPNGESQPLVSTLNAYDGCGHLEHGDRADGEWLDRCLCLEPDATHPGHFQLLRAVGEQRADPDERTCSADPPFAEWPTQAPLLGWDFLSGYHMTA